MSECTCAGPRDVYLRARFQQLFGSEAALDEQDPADRIRCGSPRRRSRRGRRGAAAAAAAAAATANQRRWRRRRRTAHGRLRHPVSARSSNRQEPGELHRLRRRTDGSDRRKDRPRPPNSRTPRSTRSSATSRQGKFEAVDLGDDDHRRTRESGRLHQPVLPRPNRRSWSKKAATIKGLGQGPRRQDRRRPAGHDRARNSSKEKAERERTPAPTPQGPDTINALKAGTSKRCDRPRRSPRTRSKKKAASKSPESRDRRRVRNRGSPRATTELLEELNQGLEEVIDDGDLHEDLRKVVPPRTAERIFTAAEQRAKARQARQSDVESGGAGDGAPFM